MRYIELEFESSRALDAVEPPLGNIQALAMPDDRRAILCDRPDGRTPRLTRLTEKKAEEIRLDAPAFQPRLLVDADEGRVLAIGRGRSSGVLFDPDGRVLGRLDLGEDIADASYDADGNIVVLRTHPPLLDRYGPEGDRTEDDAQLSRVLEQTRQDEGSLLVIQRDGTLWLNLAERYDRDGEPLDAIDPEEAFGAGRVAADLLGWDGIVVLDEGGRLHAVTAKGGRRTVRLPEREILAELGRGLTAAEDLIVTRDERMWVLDREKRKLLAFRILSE